MLKKNSIVSFVLLFIIAILGILLCVCPFAVPASTNNYNGFIFAIDKGLDLKGGVSAIYQVEIGSNGQSISTTIDQNITKIEDIFSIAGYSEIVVERQGEDKIRILASNANETDASFVNFANGKKLYVTLEKLSDTVTDATTYITGEDIAKAEPTYNYDTSAYAIKLFFNQFGKDSIAKMKDDASLTKKTTAYFYLGELSSDSFWAEVSLDDLKNGVYINASSEGAYSGSTSNTSTLTEMAYSIISGSISEDISLIQTSPISAILGKNILLFIGIATLIIVVLSLIFMFIRYGSLGLLGILANLYFIIIFLFLMQSIPFITLNLAGVFGCLIAYFISLIAIAIVFEKIKEEYALGKKIHLSCKGGQKKALWPIFDSHVMIMLASIFVWIFAPYSMKCFAITIFFGSIVSLFISLALLRWFIKLYLPINSTKAYKMHLYRDSKVKEIKEEKIVNKDEENLNLTQDLDIAHFNEGGDN